jgi:preprotein translocase subunit SecB
MKTSNLHLDNYFVKAFSFSANEDFEQTETNENSSPSFKVKCSYESIARKKHQRRCDVEIELTEISANSFPYIFSISLYGVFTINNHLETDMGEKLFRVNAPAILYSAAREIIFNMTSHTAHQAFLLPSVTFIDEDVTSEKKETSKATRKRREKTLK